VSSPAEDVAIVALAVFVLSFAILSGAGVNLRGHSGTNELLSARKVRLLISLGLAILAAVWMTRRN